MKNCQKNQTQRNDNILANFKTNLIDHIIVNNNNNITIVIIVTKVIIM